MSSSFDLKLAIRFLHQQLAHSKPHGNQLAWAESFYLDRMHHLICAEDRYLKYSKLRKFHKKAIRDAKRLYGIAMIDKRLDTFAEQNFDYIVCINNSKYQGSVGCPSNRSTSPFVVKLLRATRLW